MNPEAGPKGVLVQVHELDDARPWPREECRFGSLKPERLEPHGKKGEHLPRISGLQLLLW